MLRRGLSAAAISAVALCLIVVAPVGAAPVGADKTAARFAGVEQHGRALGDPKAPVTISFFHEIKCPFCQAFDRNVLPKVIKRYVRTGRVKIVAYPQVYTWTDNGADSRRATRFAVAMGQQNRYWNFIDLFYANQLGELDAYATDDFVSGLAALIPGADSQRAFAVRNDASVRDVLKQSKQRAKTLFVNGVPTLLVAKTGIKAPSKGEDIWDYTTVQDATSIKSIDAVIRGVERSLRN